MGVDCAARAFFETLDSELPMLMMVFVCGDGDDGVGYCMYKAVPAKHVEVASTYPPQHNCCNILNSPPR